MAIYALISGGTVRNIIAAEPGFTVAGYELVDLAGFDPIPEKGWTWDGATFTPGPGPVPQTITRHQLKVALLRVNKLDDAQTWINGAQPDPEVRIALMEATVFHRSSPSLAALAAALGYGEQALDSLFRSVSGLEP